MVGTQLIEGTVVRRLDLNDFSVVSNFITSQLITIPEDFFYPPNELIIEKSLDKLTGFSLGAFYNDQIIGVRLTYIPGLGADNHGYNLSYSVEELFKVYQFHGTLVKDEKRYYGIGSILVKMNCDLIFSNIDAIILATVHPQNTKSINMLIKHEFIAKKSVLKYSNLPRLLFEKRQ